jgi:Tol biopolymer transport system component
MGKRVLATGAIVFAIAAVLSPSVAAAAFPGKNGRIAYVGLPAGETNLDIFTVRPNGSGLQQLTDDPIEEADPSWSADGRRLAFTRFEPAGRAVFTINADGGDPTPVVNTVSPISPAPSFSPSGRQIVYTTGWTIRTVRPDGSRLRRLVSAKRQGSGLCRPLLESPRYSPSGRRIVFTGRPRGRRQEGIWTMRRDGSRLRHVVGSCSGPVVTNPDYSPDGRHIVFLPRVRYW